MCSIRIQLHQFSRRMEFHHLLPIFIVLTLALTVSYAASPPEAYWKSMLPFTPMPKSVKHVLPTGVDKGKRYVPWNPRASDVLRPLRNYVISYPRLRYAISRYAAAQHQSQKDQVHIFFLESELHPGSTLDFSFVNRTNTVTFWPRQAVKSIPFSKSKVPEILHKFSIKPKSKEAEIIKSAIMECEQPAMEGEEKFCATSLESMVDFGISKLGKHVKVVSTEAEKETMLQKYKLTTEVKFVGDKDIVCHKLNYPYALYYCHKLEATMAYSVGLKGIMDGTKVKALVICHRDTSKWNPMHVAFQELKVKPGTSSICHFLAQDTVVWVPN